MIGTARYQSTFIRPLPRFPTPAPVAHQPEADRRWRGGASPSQRPQSTPPAQCSRFQIGAVAFTSSMQKRAASNASSRCGADTATTTAASVICERAGSVQDGDPAELGPPVAAPRPRRGPATGRPAPHRPRTRASDTGATVGVVAGGAGEHDGPTAVLPHDPLADLGDRERRVREPQPRLALRLRQTRRRKQRSPAACSAGCMPSS